MIRLRSKGFDSPFLDPTFECSMEKGVCVIQCIHGKRENRYGIGIDLIRFRMEFTNGVTFKPYRECNVDG
jgi:hypothetical protein